MKMELQKKKIADNREFTNYYMRSSISLLLKLHYSIVDHRKVLLHMPFLYTELLQSTKN